MVAPTKRLHSQLHSNPNSFFLEEMEPGHRLPPGVSAAAVRNIIENLSVRKDDVFVATYPKCGTTWMQQIVKLIWNNGVEDNRDVDEVLPWIELMTIEEINVVKSPRGFKTHLPFHLMPGGIPSVNTHAKYINVYRNPKDAAVSFFYQVTSSPKMELDWNTFFENFVIGGSFFQYTLNWWKHKGE